jgi:putative flippase GtrA
MVNFEKSIKKLFLRYIKYNIVGTFVFGIGLVVYVVLFPIFGEWTYVISSLSGGVIQFSLITILNLTKTGKMFESCQTP